MVFVGRSKVCRSSLGCSSFYSLLFADSSNFASAHTFACSAISLGNVWLYTEHFVSKLSSFLNVLLSVIITGALVRSMVLVWLFKLWFGWSDFVGSVWFFGTSKGSSLSLKSLIY